VIVFRQLFDPQSSTYTYVVADARSAQALVIDPVFEQARRDDALLRELGLSLVATLETHVHADHVTGAWLLKQSHGSAIVVSSESGARGADRYVTDGERIAFGDRHLEVRATPGHTHGCVTYVLDDESMAFTGDCLLIRGSGRTDFQQGDAGMLWHSVHDKLFALPEATYVYPAHDYRGQTCSTVGEEKKWNPRLGGSATVESFVALMASLDLPPPAKIHEAVPANLACGKRD